MSNLSKVLIVLEVVRVEAFEGDGALGGDADVVGEHKVG